MRTYIRMLFVVAALMACISIGFNAMAIHGGVDYRVLGGDTDPVTRTNHSCWTTPAPFQPSICGCPVDNAHWDFCSKSLPDDYETGGKIVTAYFCAWDPGFTCVDWKSDCGVVLNCTCIDQWGQDVPCDCDGNGDWTIDGCVTTQKAKSRCANKLQECT